MDEKAFIQERIEALKESIKTFSKAGKPERERWDCARFLEILGVPFDGSMVRSTTEEPADVLFGTEAFQIKEILDPDRRRHDEYKEQLVKAQQATKASELFTYFSPKDLTPAEVCELVLEQVAKLDMKYALADRRKTNLLFYVNLRHRFFKQEPLPDLGLLTEHGWRSINVLLNSGAIVLHAAPDAPTYLRDHVGLIVRGNGG